MHPDDREVRARIASDLGPRAFTPGARAALAALGYPIVDAREAPWPACLRLIDERRFIPPAVAEAGGDTPIILFTGARPRPIRDPRIIGRVERPAQLGALYPLIQRALEPTPRLAPRFETSLAARCTRADQRWIGHIVSLSQGGCRFESEAALDPGDRMNLEFALPHGDRVCTRALVVHRHAETAGVHFVDPSQDVRACIAGFVARHLATP